MKIRKNLGYTLIEMLSVIVLIGILASLATYSVNIVFDGNTKSYASQFATALRSVRDNTLTGRQGNLEVELGNNGTNYYYCINKVGETNPIETVEFKKDVVVKEADSVGSLGTVKFKFSPSTGSAVSGKGTYLFENTVTGKCVTVKVIGKTGSVIIDD